MHCTILDEYESFSTPVSAATTFLFSLASNRTKITFMPILGFINQVLRSCVFSFHFLSLNLSISISLSLTMATIRNAPSVQKFGALNMTAALGPWIMRHPEVKNNMEQFMLQFVTPELENGEPYIQAIVSSLPSSFIIHPFYRVCVYV
jgi:hypothetical protein